MKLTIIEKNDNALLKRKEVSFRVEHEGSATPTKLEVSNLLAAKLNAKKNLMFVKNYVGSFGTNVSTGLCLIYIDETSMNRAEPQQMLNEKKRIGAAPKAKESEDAPAEEAPAEKKPEEKKPAEKKPVEEKPAEDKPAEKKPAEEKPVEKKQVEEKPVEEKPVKKKEGEA